MDDPAADRTQDTALKAAGARLSQRLAAALLGAAAVTAAWIGAGDIELRILAAVLGGLSMGYAVGARSAEGEAAMAMPEGSEIEPMGAAESPRQEAEPGPGWAAAAPIAALTAILEATRLDPEQLRWVRAIGLHAALAGGEPAGEAAAARVEYSPAAVLAEALDVLAWRAQARGVEVMAEVDPTAPARVLGDPAALRREALRWGDAALGAVTGNEVIVSLRTAGAGLRVGVEGVGDSAVTAAGLGAGERPALSLDGMRALVVEDRPASRELLAGALRRRQMTVEEAAGGEEAIERERAAALAHAPFDLILLDAEMGPALGGLAALRRFDCWLREGRTAIILMVGGRDLAGQLRAAAAAGVRHVLVKPVADSVLEATVIEALGDANREEEEAAAPAVLAPAGRRLLLVEDLASHVEVMRAYLSGPAYALTVVGTGAEAMRALERDRFDLMMLDLELPDIDGLSLAREIRAREAADDLGRMPLLCLTAHALETRERELWSAGFDGYLSKPLQRQRLLGEVDRLLADNVAYEVPEVMRQLIPGYLSDNLEAVTQMRAYLDAGDFEPVRRCGHNLKGTGSMFGFPEVTLLGAALQRAAIGGQRTEAAELLDRLEVILRKAS